MATALLVGGTASFFVNGNAYSVAQEINYNVQTIEQEWQPNWSGLPLVRVNAKTGHITVKMITDGSYDPKATFDGLGNATVIANLANGQTLSYGQAFVSEIGDVSAKDGTFDLTFQSLQIQIT